jgi:probable F420-dependent oxidoreductase
VNLGCHLPVYGPAATRDAVLRVARSVEALGFDSLWVSDHVVIPSTIRSRYPYNPTGAFPLPADTPFLEPLTTLAVVAGATERIRLGTSVLVLPHRHPVLVAKMLSTLDALAPGRVVLGAGVGWMREEIELFGVPHARRGAWSDEALRVLRACWERARPSFAGEFFRFEALGVEPRPRPGAIPIWIGGHTPAALRRVAELGDGWHAAFPSVSELRQGLEDLRRACDKLGRSFAGLTLSARVGLPGRKPSADLVAELRELAALGITHVVLESRARDADEMIALCERVAREVKPAL